VSRTSARWCAQEFIVARISESPFGRVLRAIREQDLFAQAYAKNTLYFKTCAFAVSAALASKAAAGVAVGCDRLRAQPRRRTLDGARSAATPRVQSFDTASRPNENDLA
jgi:hypothetical protein